MAELLLHVLNKDNITVAYVKPRVGLRTYAGKITRWTDKSIWVINSDGNEVCWRKSDGRLPGVYRSRARKSELIAICQEARG